MKSLLMWQTDTAHQFDKPRVRPQRIEPRLDFEVCHPARPLFARPLEARERLLHLPQPQMNNRPVGKRLIRAAWTAELELVMMGEQKEPILLRSNEV
jgi:hypothetical protein